MIQLNLTHINDQGRAKMVDVSSKDETERSAAAVGHVFMKSETLNRIKDGSIKKRRCIGCSTSSWYNGCKKLHPI